MMVGTKPLNEPTYATLRFGYLITFTDPKMGMSSPVIGFCQSSAYHMQDIGLSNSLILLMIFRPRLLQIREEVKDFSKLDGN